jgi:hypothetical protein
VLPSEMVCEVLHWLCVADIVRCQLVCHGWHSLLATSAYGVWKQAYLRTWPLLPLSACQREDEEESRKAFRARRRQRVEEDSDYDGKRVDEGSDEDEGKGKKVDVQGGKIIVPVLAGGNNRDADWRKVALQRLRLDVNRWPRSTLSTTGGESDRLWF